MDFNLIKIGPPTVPGNNATVTLFDSSIIPGGLSTNKIARVRFDFAGINQDSAVLGLRGYKSPNRGTTWYEATFDVALPIQITADTGADSMSVDINVTGLSDDVKFTYTAGATAPTVWSPTITLQTGSVESGG